MLDAATLAVKDEIRQANHPPLDLRWEGHTLSVNILLLDVAGQFDTLSFAMSCIAVRQLNPKYDFFRELFNLLTPFYKHLKNIVWHIKTQKAYSGEQA